ncbi:unnamed protein product [Rotaria sp. Silwood1]|nr:unnamed protein product [Rotaria sp. Silwood1]
MKFNTTNDLDYHKLNECTKITVPCALKDYGCLTSVVRVEIGEHYKSEEHQSAIINFIRRILSKINDQHDRGSTMDVDTLSHTTMLSSDNINNQLQEVCQTIDILADGVSTLNGDAQRLSQESLQLHNTIDNLTREFAILKISIQEQGTYLDGLKPNQDVLNQDVTSLKQKLDDMQFVSYDGTLLWKIPNFSSRMADAQSERQTSIYSPPFYSSPTGYKMRGRLYLNGDGNARLTFCLYDQTPAQRHIIDSFRPDVKSNSFQRPRSEMNIASGIPKFCSLSTIQQEGNAYVRDDTMFIKIMVDFADTPKTLLPFALTLNPGFPINIQQTLIKQEAEKRTQQTSTPPAT